MLVQVAKFWSTCCSRGIKLLRIGAWESKFGDPNINNRIILFINILFYLFARGDADRDFEAEAFEGREQGVDREPVETTIHEIGDLRPTDP